jgi:hypothetical protein
MRPWVQSQIPQKGEKERGEREGWRVGGKEGGEEAGRERRKERRKKGRKEERKGKTRSFKINVAMDAPFVLSPSHQTPPFVHMRMQILTG